MDKAYFCISTLPNCNSLQNTFWTTAIKAERYKKISGRLGGLNLSTMVTASWHCKENFYPSRNVWVIKSKPLLRTAVMFLVPWRSLFLSTLLVDSPALQVPCTWGCICSLFHNPSSSWALLVRFSGAEEQGAVVPCTSSGIPWRCHKPCKPL